MTTMTDGATARSGLKGASTGFLYEEFLPELRGVRGAKQYREMAENDGIVGAMLFLCEMLVRNVEWRVEPKDKSPAAADGAQFVDEVLFQDMAHPFSALVEDALTMLIYGYAPMEVVFKRRGGPQRQLIVTSDNIRSRPTPPPPSSLFNDGKVGINRVFLLNQDTIWKWFFDAEDTWIGLEQITESSHSTVVPRDKLLNFRTNRKLDNPEGRSVLRNAFISYTRKKALEIGEGRLAMRSAGIVEIALPQEYFAPDAPDEVKADLESYRQLGIKLAQDRQGVVLVPSTTQGENGTGARRFSISYITADGRSTADLSVPIVRYEQRIAGSMLADFLLMGQQAVGSYALVGNRASMFANALRGFVRSIRDEINLTLLPRLWRANGMPQETMPKVAHGDFEKRDLDQLALFLEAMTRSGAQLFPDTILENHLRAAAQLPLREEDPALADGGDDGEEDLPDDDDPETPPEPPDPTRTAAAKRLLAAFAKRRAGR